MATVVLIAFLLSLLHPKQSNAVAPNIVFLMFDDLGWSDASFNGGLITTKHIDALRSQSVFLQRHYIHFVCSISRSQFLTGRYAMYSGYGRMHTFGPGEIGGIPIGLPTIAQWLKEYGNYNTMAVGKWHSGYAFDGLLPHSHGFDHFFGFYGHSISYTTFLYGNPKICDCNSQRWDFHDDGNDYTQLQLNIENSVNTMDLYRERILDNIRKESHSNNPFYIYLPLQSPHGPLPNVNTYKNQCKDMLSPIASNHALKYCEILLLSDDIIGDIINELKINNLWTNTLFVMTTDNGGDIEYDSSNYPLRGTKGSLFEGNQRVIALVGGGVIPKSQYGTVRNSLVSNLDWTPTLLEFAGIYDQIAESDQTWDGINQYDMIMNGDDYKNRVNRDHIVFNIGLRNLESAAVIFKYPNDNNKLYKYISLQSDIDFLKRINGWSIINYENKTVTFVSDDIEQNPNIADSGDLNNTYLFNLIDDISEERNLLLTHLNQHNVHHVLKYANELFKPYLDNPLYSENIECLWNYHKEEDLSDKGIFYIDPWMKPKQYLEDINVCFEKEFHNDNVISDQLKDVYLNKWISPKRKNDIEHILSEKIIGNSMYESFNKNHYYAYLMAMCIFVGLTLTYATVKRSVSNTKYHMQANYGSV